MIRYGAQGNPKLCPFVHIEDGRRIAIVFQFRLDFGNTAVEFVHIPQHFDGLRQQRIPIIADKGEIIRLRLSVQPAGVGDFKAESVIIVKFDRGIADLVVPVDDGVQQQLADGPLRITVNRLLLQGGNPHRTRRHDSDFYKGVEFVDGLQKRSFIGVFG